MKNHEIISALGLAVVKAPQTPANATSVRVEREQFALVAQTLVNSYGLPLSLLYGSDDRAIDGTFGVHALFSNDASHEWIEVVTHVPEQDPTYPALTATIMAAHWYERYLMDMFGVKPEGHPDLRRLVHHENIPAGTHPLRKDFAVNTVLPKANEPYPMHHVEGEGIYEIPVGPIHAGIIEPGHFRFNVAGERIITLEGKLFFTHKGIEKILEGKTIAEALPLVERLSGDSAASNALAFAQAIEQISNVVVPARALALRTLISELERITMHIHDLANIPGNGTGYTVMAAQGFRIKERLMRLSEELVGNRFWRGYIVPGGCSADWNKEQLKNIATIVGAAVAEMEELVTIALTSDGLRERLETTGVLPREAAIALGGLGLPVRASGVMRDVRRDHPYADYGTQNMPVVTQQSGDVYARFVARVAELADSATVVERICRTISAGPVHTSVPVATGAAIGSVEAWRGELLCVVSVRDGVIERCVLRDPSFCNWALFGIIGPGNIVPDFPLCNKSLNLSYSGADL